MSVAQASSSLYTSIHGIFAPRSAKIPASITRRTVVNVARMGNSFTTGSPLCKLSYSMFSTEMSLSYAPFVLVRWSGQLTYTSTSSGPVKDRLSMPRLEKSQEITFLGKTPRIEPNQLCEKRNHQPTGTILRLVFTQLSKQICS
ncbi:uncharacterized protein LOC131327556 [Rhododendron vialii]|uniref:uncharacterized protein LOC131327556 n=1 Tax=Rhododendron vialii TaxID=182163 RepID=UPI00265F9B9A|nr:uncharacterized protein LOC131327556 [Rhododendron vialii]